VAPARTHIKQQITSLLSGVKGAERLAAIEEERSERRLTARVNARYLDGVPVSMVPPDILSALPRLPREVEYHFLERHLILLDGDARIILDVLRDVLPCSPCSPSPVLPRRSRPQIFSAAGRLRAAPRHEAGGSIARPALQTHEQPRAGSGFLLRAGRSARSAAESNPPVL
jgi:hypothetical protein